MAHKKRRSAGYGWGTPRKPTPRASLHYAYAAAKTARHKAGVAYRKHKTPANRAAYKAAEMRWQATGQALGSQSGTHKPRHARTHLFKGRKRSASVAKHNRSVARRRKNTRTTRRR